MKQQKWYGMSTSNRTYKELSIPFFKEVFEIIDKILVKKKVPYYLVGVNAIALELLKKGIKPNRGTKDIDFALMVSSMGEYDKIVDAFVEEGFTKAKAPFTVYHPKFNVAVDLLPFGQIEESDTDSFNERYSDLHVLGFREVLEDTKEIPIENSVAKVPPLAGMVILKLIAWSDRPEERDNDLTDILRIIEVYYDYEWDTIVEEHVDLLEAEPFDQHKIASRLLGREACKYLLKSNVLSERILELLENNLADLETSAIIRRWASIKNIEAREAMSLLGEFEKGLKEGINFNRSS